jgi:hypothetical protein
MRSLAAGYGMTEIPTEGNSANSPASIAFWLSEARLLKETADLSWDADLNVMQRAKLIYGPQHDRVLRHATEELGMELNLLYRYLVSLAIQYLAIGLLIDRDPRYFLQQQPGHKIVKLLRASGVALSAQQLELLSSIENAYDWAERYPFGELGDSHDELRQLTHQLSQMDRLTQEEKQALDGLYEHLLERVERRVEAGATDKRGV